MQNTIPTPGTISWGRRLTIAAAALGLMLVSGFAQSALAQGGAAQNGAPPLNFYKDYIVPGANYVVAGVGLRGTGNATTDLTPPTPITISVPAGPVVGAFLYWQTVEKAPSAFAGQQGFFNGFAIIGKILGNPNTPTSWSSGGCSGASQGTTTISTYRADVRPFLPLVNGVLQGNGIYEVQLADSGSNGGGTPLTLGATLVIIYRVQSAAPLGAVVIYDGSFSPGKVNQVMSQTINGFYDADMTHSSQFTEIVGNGSLNKIETLYFNGTQIGPTNAFPGSLNGSWDNPTFTTEVTPLVKPGDGQATTMVVPAKTNSGCVTWGAVIFKTTVPDSDGDGLLDSWKTNQGYTDFSNGQFVSLPGAKRFQKDLFIQLDHLESHDFITSNGAQGHSHQIKQGALDMLGKMYADVGIQLDVDCGSNCYPGDPYVIPGVTRVNNVIDESDPKVTCQDNLGATPPFYCQFPGVPATGWKGGLTVLRNQPPSNYTEAQCEAADLAAFQNSSSSACVRRFLHGQGLSYHYVLMGHALGLATNFWTISSTNPSTKLISIVVDGVSNTATVTTSSPHGLISGARVTVSGAISPVPVFGQDFTLNGTYPSITVPNVPSPTTFTFPTPTNVPAGTYSNPGLFVSSGLARSTSGWSDRPGGDTIVTLGLWRSDVPGDDQVGSVNTQAGTVAHELGHTFGFNHGGGDPINCKSNYQSVMNYQFQVRLLPGFDGLLHINYSDQILPDLNEASLDESMGIGAAATTYGTRWFAPLNFLDKQLNTTGGRAATTHCDGTLILDGAQMVRVEGPAAAGLPIDWNNDGNTRDTGFAQDINFNDNFFNLPVGSNVDSPFAGYNDWANLDLRQIGARRGAFGFSGDVWGTTDDGTGGTTDDGTGGTTDDGTGGTTDDGTGGTTDDGTGGQESDFDRANSTVDPPTGLTCTNCFLSSGTLQEKGKSVSFMLTPPGFGQIRTYHIWRANTTNGPISATNLPMNIKDVTGTPAPTTFTDSTVKNNTTYTYFVTAALGTDSGKNSGNQSGASNTVTVTVNF